MLVVVVVLDVDIVLVMVVLVDVVVVGTAVVVVDVAIPAPVPHPAKTTAKKSKTTFCCLSKFIRPPPIRSGSAVQIAEGSEAPIAAGKRTDGRPVDGP